MRRIWRALQLIVLVTGYTLYVQAKVRWVPPAQRALFRARHQSIGSRWLCRVLGIRVSLQGEWSDGKAMLCVCNHIGILDPFILASQWPTAFAGKAEIRRWPLFGCIAATFGVFFVERERRSLVSDFVQVVRKKLRDGVHVLVFPEGTTNAAPTLLPFKTSAFEAVADLADACVLPLYLHPVSVNGQPATGAVREQVVWAGSKLSFVEKLWQMFALKQMHFEVRIGTPIEAAGRNRKELADAAYEHVSALAAQEPRHVLTFERARTSSRME